MSDFDSTIDSETITSINNDTITEAFDFDNVEKKNEIIVPDDERITIPKLTKYERVRLLGDRAKQISEAAKTLIRTEKSKSAMDTAILELEHKIIPLKVIRKRPDGKIEIWKVSELDI